MRFVHTSQRGEDSEKTVREDQTGICFAVCALDGAPDTLKNVVNAERSDGTKSSEVRLIFRRVISLMLLSWAVNPAHEAEPI